MQILLVLAVLTIVVNCVLGIVVWTAGTLAVITFYIGQAVGMITLIMWYVGSKLDDGR